MSRRRLPKFLRIVGFRVPVTVIDNLHHENGDIADPDHLHRAYGVFAPGDLAIYLDAASGSERTKNTLVHEGLHAMLNAAHIQMDPEDEENMVGRLAPLLLDFIRANRGAILYLQES